MRKKTCKICNFQYEYNKDIITCPNCGIKVSRVKFSYDLIIVVVVSLLAILIPLFISGVDMIGRDTFNSKSEMIEHLDGWWYCDDEYTLLHITEDGQVYNDNGKQLISNVYFNYKKGVLELNEKKYELKNGKLILEKEKYNGKKYEVEFLKKEVKDLVGKTLGDGEFEYYVQSDGLSIKAPDTIDESLLIIPSEYDGVPVIEMGFGAFSSGTFSSVNIPNSIKIIGYDAFQYCKNLKSISIGDNVVEIKSNAFEGCSNLSSVTLGDGIKEISYCAFKNCTSLNSISIPSGVEEIASSAFSGCSSLKSLILPNGLKNIGSSAFHPCVSLTSINIPNTVTTIGKNAFRGCSSLKTITIPKNVTSIGEYAFGGCDKLTISCEAGYQQSGWDSTWNSSNCPVLWGATSTNPGSTSATQIASSLLTVGKTFKLGKYEQDNDASNGMEDIEWIVLKKNDGEALLQSKYCLDTLTFSTTQSNLTWENSNVRTWLNNSFYNTAFNSIEKNIIINSRLLNEGDNPTYDNVFLLSKGETETYYSYKSARKAGYTQYAVNRGIYTNQFSDEKTTWYLRNIVNNASVLVGLQGEFAEWDTWYGDEYYTKAGIRPAIWVKTV